MSASFDPFGSAVLDYLSGTYHPEIEVESTITENETIPVAYLFRSWNEMPEKEKFALSLVQGKILDVGAGAGSHSLFLQEQKKDVVANDQSAKCCLAMQQRGIKHVLQQDFYKLDEKDKYDSLLFLMNGFGIAGTLENLEVFFMKCSALLNPGGLIIGESADILYMFEEEDGSYLIDLNAAYYGEVQYRMSYKNEQGKWFPWLYTSMDLLIETAEKYGFKLYQHFQGVSDDYIVCLQKQ